jgi:outer membrane protein TolC
MRNYFDVVELEQLRDISAAQADILRERVTLAERSFLRGLASSFELISLRESRREAEANVPQIDARLYGAKARLAVLLGTYPDAIDETLAKADRLEVTLAMDAIPAGLPARLLARRPDILAARRRLDAARYGVAAAEAAQLPQITFNASGGLDSGKPGGVLDPQNWFVNLLGSITAPILDGGRLGAQVDLREAELRQRAQSYGRTVLEAFAEVEQALARHEAAVERMELLAADLDSARAAADLQLRRFERGTGNYSDYLDSRLNVLNSRRLMVQAERGVAEARLGVHRALGGAWKRDWLEPVNRERTAMAGGSDG